MSDAPAPVQESRHVSVWIAVAPPVAYGYVADRRNLPSWVAGLDTAQVDLEFTAPNELGVLDHVVRIPGQGAFYNPMRVLPAGEGQTCCEVVFTVRRRPGMSDEEFNADVAAVTADLQALRQILERG